MSLHAFFIRKILVCVIDVSYSLPVRELAEGAPRGNSDLHCRRAACWHGIFLSRQLRAAFSGGEIHSLGRLRLEGFPESLSRTWGLVHRNVGSVCVEVASPATGVRVATMIQPPPQPRICTKILKIFRNKLTAEFSYTIINRKCVEQKGM